MYLCISICIYVYLCVSICIYMYLCVSLCIHVDRSGLPLFVFRSVLPTEASLLLSDFFGITRSMLSFKGREKRD